MYFHKCPVETVSTKTERNMDRGKHWRSEVGKGMHVYVIIVVTDNDRWNDLYKGLYRPDGFCLYAFRCEWDEALTTWTVVSTGVYAVKFHLVSRLMRRISHGCEGLSGWLANLQDVWVEFRLKQLNLPGLRKRRPLRLGGVRPALHLVRVDYRLQAHIPQTGFVNQAPFGSGIHKRGLHVGQKGFRDVKRDHPRSQISGRMLIGRQ